MTADDSIPCVGLPQDGLAAEIERISSFIASGVGVGPAVLAVSGGLDSDVVARLAVRALGSDHLKVFVVIQDGMDTRHLTNARELADDLHLDLKEIDLRGFPERFVQALSQGDATERFRPTGLLDPSRAKCSLRTPILSSYQDRGYTVLGTSNRTEYVMGFFLPFGDGLAHLKPIIHLYKTEVFQLGRFLGTRPVVLDQPPSSGFWEGAEDLTDIAYWLYAGEPIREERSFSKEDVTRVDEIRSELTFERIDLCLECNRLNLSMEKISEMSGLSAGVVKRMQCLTQAAVAAKHRSINRQLER